MRLRYFSFRFHIILVLALFFTSFPVCADETAGEQIVTVAPRAPSPLDTEERPGLQGWPQGWGETIWHSIAGLPPGQRAEQRVRHMWRKLGWSPHAALPPQFGERLLEVQHWMIFLNLCCRVLPHDVGDQDKISAIYRLARLDEARLVKLAPLSRRELKGSWQLVCDGEGWREVVDLITSDTNRALHKLLFPIRILWQCGLEVDEMSRDDYAVLRQKIEDHSLEQCEDLLELCYMTFRSRMSAADRFAILEQCLFKLKPECYPEYEIALDDLLLKLLVSRGGKVAKDMLRAVVDALNDGEAFDASLKRILYECERDYFLSVFMGGPHSVHAELVKTYLSQVSEDVQPTFLLLCHWCMERERHVFHRVKAIKRLFDLVNQMGGGALDYTNLCLEVIQPGLNRAHIRDVIESLAELGADRYEFFYRMWDGHVSSRFPSILIRDLILSTVGYSGRRAVSRWEWEN